MSNIFQSLFKKQQTIKSVWNTSWISMADCHFPAHGYHPISIKGDEIIISGKHSLFQYMCSSNKWIECIKYPPTLSIGSHCAALDKSLNILYIRDKNQLIKINLTTQNIQVINNQMLSNVPPFLIVIDHKLHSICGSKSISDSIWNDKKKQFEEYKSLNEFATGYSEFGTIYNSKNKSILMIGGYDWGISGSTNRIYLYSLITRELNTSHITIMKSMDGFGYVLTHDSQYFIMFGGYDGDQYKYSNDIYIMDLSKGYDNIKIKRCAIKAPIPRTFQAVLESDTKKEELLTFGYIRYFFKNMKHMSDDLMKLIRIFVVRFEYVHLFATQGKKGHWKMKLDNILLSMIN